MSSWLFVIVLAVVQGLTEFLPVSSSGHLAILGLWFGVNPESSLSLGIMLHAGSLLAIAAFYFKTLWGFFRRDQLSLLGMVIAGSIPAGVAGVGLKLSGWDERLFGDPIVIALAFMVTGALLRLSNKPALIRDGGHPSELKTITLRQSILVGLAQMLAIVPGLSRSGSTITAGILSGIERESAATFSFLLALPAIAGATLIEMAELVNSGGSGMQFSMPQLSVAVALSAVVSFAALSVLVRLVRRGRLDRFAWYLFALGVAVLIWQLKVKLG